MLCLRHLYWTSVAGCLCWLMIGHGYILTRAPPPLQPNSSQPTQNPPGPIPSKPKATTEITSCDTDPAQHYLLRSGAEGTTNEGPTRHHKDYIHRFWKLINYFLDLSKGNVLDILNGGQNRQFKSLYATVTSHCIRPLHTAS